MDIKKRKQLSVKMDGNKAMIKAVDPVDTVGMEKAKEGKGLIGLSANLSALKKGKDVTAKTDGIPGAFPGVKAGQVGPDIPSAKSDEYKERIKKRAK